MRRRSGLVRIPFAVSLAGVILLSCSEPATSPRLAPSVPQLTDAPAPAQIVISQVYSGGGNSGAIYNRKYVELFNRGGSTASLSGWSLQYASASGTGNFAANTIIALSGSIGAGQYVLVQVSTSGSSGAALPVSPDIVGGNMNPAAAAGKLIVANTTTGLACNGGSTPCSPTQLAQIVDLVGYGTTANFYEGSAAAPALSSTLAGFRKSGGCQDTNDNSADFSTAAPAPRNRASAVHVCPGALPPGPLDHVVVTGPSTVDLGSGIQLAASPQDANNQTIGTATVTWTSSDNTIATVDNTGRVSAVSASATPVTITATADDNGITKSGTAQVTVVIPAINWIDVSTSSTSFPPGFQTQTFATARTVNGGTIIPATFTFEAVDAQNLALNTVQNTGLITGLAATDPLVKAAFRITATPTGGGQPYSFVSRSITIEAPVTAPTSIYATNDEFGDPTAASQSNSDDFLIQRAQYTLSYNQSRGTPNWVSYELDARQMVAGQDRCNCFTADPLLPAAKQIFTSDYTSGGYDRGHMTRSADRTAANVDNATTFYLTNIVPQMADLNQGVWAQFENALGDSARAGRAVYIITGPLYSRSHGLTFLKNEGKVAIPDSTWKVALIGPGNGGNPFTRANVQTWDDLIGLTILAVNMPNVAGVRNDPWTKYLTTPLAIEQATGLDFLSALSASLHDALGAEDHAPVAQFRTTGVLSEGTAIGFDASTSTDADVGRADMGRAESLTYAWDFGDGTTASGRTPTKTFATYGSYTAKLTVTDAFGWPDTRSLSLTIANVAPVVEAFAGATLLQGETYTAGGSFTDPGVEPWTATVDYGDGGGSAALALTGKAFSLEHAYSTAGTFTVGVVVNDGAASGSGNATVVVLAPAQAIGHLIDVVDGLGLDNGEANSLDAKLRAANAQLKGGQPTAAVGILGAFSNEVQALVNSERLTSEAADPVLAYAQRLVESILR